MGHWQIFSLVHACTTVDVKLGIILKYYLLYRLKNLHAHAYVKFDLQDTKVAPYIYLQMRLEVPQSLRCVSAFAAGVGGGPAHPCFYNKLNLNILNRSG